MGLGLGGDVPRGEGAQGTVRKGAGGSQHTEVVGSGVLEAWGCGWRAGRGAQGAGLGALGAH